MKDKEKITKSLGRVRDNLDVVIANLNELGKDNKTDRLANNRIALTMFEICDEIGDTEVDIYNYLKRRQNGLHTKKELKERAPEHKEPKVG